MPSFGFVITVIGGCPSAAHAVVPFDPSCSHWPLCWSEVGTPGNDTKDAIVSSKRGDQRGTMWCWQGRAGEAVSAALTAQLEHAFDPSCGNSEWSS